MREVKLIALAGYKIALTEWEIARERNRVSQVNNKWQKHINSEGNLLVERNRRVIRSEIIMLFQ
jgi:hypothetical protein